MNLNDKIIGRQTRKILNPISIRAAASIVGKKEGEGPLSHYFDFIGEDSYFGEASWEKAESAMMQRAFTLCCDKAKLEPSALDYIFSGDLLNQCTSSVYALRDFSVPYFGLYGACSTISEAMMLASLVIDGGYAENIAALTSSHFCSSERQFRFPLEYGCVRPQTSQWTVTGSAAIIVSALDAPPYITSVTTGKIMDAGICDMSNMGAAMAVSAYDTLSCHFKETGRKPSYYDAIISGDLGAIGQALVRELFSLDGIDLGERYLDCGTLIFDRETQDVHAGGSGAACSATVFASYILKLLEDKTYNKILFAPTGALMSTTSSLQGESIPSICHAIAIENVRS